MQTWRVIYIVLVEQEQYKQKKDMKNIDEVIDSKRSEIILEKESTEKGLILEFMGSFHEKYGIDTGFFEQDDKESLSNYVDLLRKEWKSYKK